jgi:hypothetical protein
MEDVMSEPDRFVARVTGHQAGDRLIRIEKPPPQSI